MSDLTAPGESIRDLVEARIDRVQRDDDSAEYVAGLVDSTGNKARVSSLEPGVGDVDGVAEILSDSAHTDDSTGGGCASLPDAESLSLRDEIDERQSELDLDALKPRIVDLHGSNQINQHRLVDVDNTRRRMVCVMPCCADVDLPVEPLTELHVSPSIVDSAAVPAVVGGDAA